MKKVIVKLEAALQEITAEVTKREQIFESRSESWQEENDEYAEITEALNELGVQIGEFLIEINVEK